MPVSLKKAGALGKISSLKKSFTVCFLVFLFLYQNTLKQKEFS
jgi:hypothetical protein